MKQKATVVSTDGKYAVVKVDRTSMCDGCHKSGCSDGCALYKIFGAKSEFEAKCLNEAGASTGDIVWVEASDASVNISAFFVFMLPVIVAGLVYCISSRFADEIYRIIASVVSFVVYFAILVVIERVKKDKANRLVISEIVASSAD